MTLPVPAHDFTAHDFTVNLSKVSMLCFYLALDLPVLAPMILPVPAHDFSAQCANLLPILLHPSTEHNFI
jgi:hypothetical protein